MNNSLPANYDEKVSCLSGEEFFDFFSRMDVEPQWVNSAGKRSIQIIGRCHHGHGHSAVFDPDTRKVTCFSSCGKGMMLHTWVKRALDMGSPQEAKDFIEDWMDGQDIDFSSRDPTELDDYTYHERPFVPEHIEPLPGIGEAAERELYSKFDATPETLERTVWHTKDGIDVEQLVRFQVAINVHKTKYCKSDIHTIILPHHNINGEIVGLYERSFLPLRADVKKDFPDAEYEWLCQFPRAKYVPLLKEGHFAEEDTKKTSWSFSNSNNLYGLHLAKDAIKETGKAIIFEGAKSVMLAHQYGYPFAVASHTFGANVNHISMLIECGAKEIILAFDRQYETVDEEDQQWKLYEKKTRELAEKVRAYVNVSRIVDYDDHPLLHYKDAPIDQGAEAFRELYERREMLVIDGISQQEQERLRRELSQKEALAKIARSIPKASAEECAADDDLFDEPAAEYQEPQENETKSAAEPLFHGEPIAWLNEPNPAGKGTEHFVLWKGEKYKQSAFFEAAYPEQYNKIRKRVKFKDAAAENVFRLSGNQRTILMYRCLASKFPLEEVSELDSIDLQGLCIRERDNTTAAELASRLRWENGLALLVTFGASLNYNEKQNDSTAAAHTWCYSVEYETDRAIFRGIKMTWEIWSVRLKDILDKCRLHGQSNKAMWESVRPAIYCQSGKRLTLLREDYFQICDWVTEYFSGFETPFPLQGEIPDADFQFVVDYNADAELVENRSLNSPAAMSEYNRETNAVGNVQKGKEKVLRRFQAAFPDCKPGDQMTTAQLKERGYTDDKAIKRLVDHGIVDRLRRGLYIVKNV